LQFFRKVLPRPTGKAARGEERRGRARLVHNR
jgi:hypothetical protein